jgi:hypothetical protein
VDAASTWFQLALEKRLADLAQERTQYLADGSAQDYPDYRHRVGYLRALTDVHAICEDIAKEDAGGDLRTAFKDAPRNAEV